MASQTENYFILILHLMADADTDKYYFGIRFFDAETA